jgi:hypothetical protein
MWPPFGGHHREKEEFPGGVFGRTVTTKHLHSAIGYVTPTSRHQGLSQAIHDKRNETYASAYTAHPERWAKNPKIWAGPKVVYLNPSEETKFAAKGGLAA